MPKKCKAPRGWRLGRRRNDPGPDWPETLDRLRSLLATPIAKVRSRKVLARAVGVDEATVRCWLAGTGQPEAERAQQVRDWLAANEG